MAGARVRSLVALASLLLLAACGRVIPSPEGPRPPPATALGLGVHRGPSIADLPIAGDDAAAALVSFREKLPAPAGAKPTAAA